MIPLIGIGRQNYRTATQTLDAPPCPSCEATLKPHGSYQRYIDGERTKIRRGRCPPCKVTHALLPEDVCAYRDLPLQELATVLSADGPSEAAQALKDPSPTAVRRVRRWRQEAQAARARQNERILPEIRAPAPWWQRAIEAFGDLVVARLQLWRQTGYFATPMLGLFRHGRPPWVVARFST